MSKFRGTVFADKWPFNTDVEATNFHVAAARILTNWEKRFKGKKRPDAVTIKIVRGD